MDKGPGAVGTTSIWDREEGENTRKERPVLGRAEIVRAAIRVADAEGPEAVSMRRIARELGSGTMSLYRHVEKKEDLLQLMLDEVYGEMELPEGLTGEWREDLRVVSHRTRETLLQHPWVSTVLGGRFAFGPNVLRRVELGLGVLYGSGLDSDAVAGAFGAVNDYVMGAVMRELSEGEALRRGGRTPDEERAAASPYVRRVMERGEHPNFARYVREAPHLDDPAERFEVGLGYVLDGIDARLRRRRRR